MLIASDMVYGFALTSIGGYAHIENGFRQTTVNKQINITDGKQIWIPVYLKSLKVDI